MASTRQRRVEELLVQEISDIVRREMKDPRIGFVTITDAEVTADLRHAKIFFSVLGDQSAREETTKALNRAAGFLRTEFARRAQMRHVPELRFQFDPSIERGARISQLLAQVREEREERERSQQNEPDADGADTPGGGADPSSE